MQQKTQKKQIMYMLLPAAVQTMTVTMTSQLNPAQEPARARAARAPRESQLSDTRCLIRSLSWGFQKWNTND